MVIHTGNKMMSDNPVSSRYQPATDTCGDGSLMTHSP